MAPRQRIIIDTDPGVDDILAMLLAFASSPEELEVVLISLTFGNVDVQNCLRNVMTLFHIIEKEQEWRRKNNLAEGFAALKACPPLVAVGAEEPLADQIMMADFFHGRDGLGDTHTSHPHLSPSESWKTLFNPSLFPKSSPVQSVSASELQQTFTAHASFTPSNLPAHKQILRTLKENPADTITIVAVGPLTNLALAAAEDVVTFLRVKEVVVMGGAIDVPGNISPLAEFNTHSDAYAFARILALTSPGPPTTMPPTPPIADTFTSETPSPYLPYYPLPLPHRLNLSLLPLDITTIHTLTTAALTATATPLQSQGSPLAEWVIAFLTPTLQRSKATNRNGLSLHDPLAIWYTVTSSISAWTVEEDRDIRVETAGQWTRGACIVDRRGFKKAKAYAVELVEGKEGPVVPREANTSEAEPNKGNPSESNSSQTKPNEPQPSQNPRAKPSDSPKTTSAKKGDASNWLDEDSGNRVRLVVASPGGNEVGAGEFEGELLGRIFGRAKG